MFKKMMKKDKMMVDGDNKRKHKVVETEPCAYHNTESDGKNKGHYQEHSLDETIVDGTISPIIFTPEGICGNAQPFAKPITNFRTFNQTLDVEQVAGSMVSREICDLNYNNSAVIGEMISNYIVQQAFLSFCGYLDSLMGVNKLGVMQYTNIRERCMNNLVNSRIVHNILRSEFGFDSCFTAENFENRAENLYHFCGVIAKQLSHAIHEIYCRTIDESINELVLMNPFRIETEYTINTCLSYSEELRKVREENPANIPSLVAIWLKSLLMERIDELMTVVSIGIEDAIVYFGSSNYFTFGDYLNSINQNNRNKY